MSPLLFALYIRGMGKELCSTEVGVMLGNVCISCLFFADDLAIKSDLKLKKRNMLNINYTKGQSKL